MALKKNKYTAVGSLIAANVEMTTDFYGHKENRALGEKLVFLIATLLDNVATQEITHFTIGTPTAKNAFLLTVNFPDKSVMRAGGTDIYDLVENAIAELTDGYDGGDGDGVSEEVVPAPKRAK